MAITKKRETALFSNYENESWSFLITIFAILSGTYGSKQSNLLTLLVNHFNICANSFFIISFMIIIIIIHFQVQRHVQGRLSYIYEVTCKSKGNSIITPSSYIYILTFLLLGLINWFVYWKWCFFSI